MYNFFYVTHRVMLAVNTSVYAEVKTSASFYFSLHSKSEVCKIFILVKTLLLVNKSKFLNGIIYFGYQAVPEQSSHIQQITYLKFCQKKKPELFYALVTYESL